MAPRTKTPPAPPTPEACEELLKVIRATAEPQSAKPLVKLLVAPHKIAEKQLLPILDEYVASGILFRFPPKTTKGQPRYWDRDILELARLDILKLVAAKGPQKQPALRKAVKWLGDDQFERLFQSLIATRTLWSHPPFGKVKQEVFAQRPPTPEPYLLEVGTLLTRAVEKLLAAHVPQVELRRALFELIEESGVELGPTQASGGCQPPDSSAAQTDESSRPQVDLIALMKELEPGAERGALIGSRDLRRIAGLDKAQFDSAVLELSRQGRLSLHRHDFVTSLSPTERDDLVTDGAGTYYVGMAIRSQLESRS